MVSNRTQNQVSNVLVSGVKRIVNRRVTPWVGTMTDLGSVLSKVMGRQVPETWLRSPSSLRVALNKVVRQIRGSGVRVRFSRSTDSSRTRLVEFSVH